MCEQRCVCGVRGHVLKLAHSRRTRTPRTHNTPRHHSERVGACLECKFICVASIMALGKHCVFGAMLPWYPSCGASGDVRYAASMLTLTINIFQYQACCTIIQYYKQCSLILCSCPSLCSSSYCIKARGILALPWADRSNPRRTHRAPPLFPVIRGATTNTIACVGMEN